MHQIRSRLGLCPKPRSEEAHSAPTDPLAGFKGSYTSKGREGDGGRVRRRGKGFYFIFKHSLSPKKSRKISRGDPGKSWKSAGFFISKRVGTLWQRLGCMFTKLTECNMEFGFRDMFQSAEKLRRSAVPPTCNSSFSRSVSVHLSEVKEL